VARRSKGIHVWFRRERDCYEVGEYIAGKRKRYATGLSCIEDAEKKLAEIILDLGTLKTPEIDITLGEIIAYYSKEHLPTISSPLTAIKCFERLLPFWGDSKLAHVRKSKCLEYLAYRKDEFLAWQKANGYKSVRHLSDETVRRELEQLQAAIRYAHSDNIINSFPSIWKPKKCKPKERWLTGLEVAKLLSESKKLDQASEYLPLFILLALYTGARSNAVLTLRWPQIDFITGTIDFRAGQNSKTKGGAIIPIPKRLFRELKKARKRGSSSGFVIHRDQQAIGSIKNSFGTACKRAGLENVTPHTLRHTAASWMVQKGVPIYDVAKYLGHSSIAMVEKTYGHMAPEHLHRAKESWG
jgi:integrase